MACCCFSVGDHLLSLRIEVKVCAENARECVRKVKNPNEIKLNDFIKKSSFLAVNYRWRKIATVFIWGLRLSQSGEQSIPQGWVLTSTAPRLWATLLWSITCVVLLSSLRGSSGSALWPSSVMLRFSRVSSANNLDGKAVHSVRWLMWEQTETRSGGALKHLLMCCQKYHMWSEMLLLQFQSVSGVSAQVWSPDRPGPMANPKW